MLHRMKSVAWRWLSTLATALPVAATAHGQSPSAPAWAPYRQPLAANWAEDDAEVAAPLQSLAEREIALAQQQARLDMSITPTQAVEAVPCEVPCDVPCESPMVMGGAPMTLAPNCVAPAPGYVLATSPYVDADSPSLWKWRLLPADVTWQSYWAGVHEPRIGAAVYHEIGDDTYLDAALGGRAALVRYGTQGGDGVRPTGWELQLEGAAFPRLNLAEQWDLEATDFRVGVPLIYARERWQWKLAYYHLSAHMGDEFAIRNGGAAALAQRINFSRDAIVTALSFYPLPAWRWYAEAGYAFYTDGGSEPFEFQFGVDVAEPGPTGAAGTPFFAVNGHLREEHNFGGNLSVQGGWLWRGPQYKVLRLGVHYYNGKGNQFQFFDQFEHQIGGGMWYDF